MNKTNNVAIDGPAGTGKTTLAALLAERLGFKKLDTGALYRAVTLQVLGEPASMNNESRCIEFAQKVSVTFDKFTSAQHIMVDSVDVTDKLRTPEVSSNVSHVSAFPGVRHVIDHTLQTITAEGGFVAEGFIRFSFSIHLFLQVEILVLSYFRVRNGNSF